LTFLKVAQPGSGEEPLMISPTLSARRVRTAASLAAALALFGGTSGVAQTEPSWSAADRALAVRALAEAGELSPAEGAAVDDAALTQAVERYAALELGQRLRPDAVDRMWAVAPARRDVAAELAAARASGGFGAWIASLTPPSGQYKALASAGRRYRAIAEHGGWAALSAGASLQAGKAGPQVAALRDRLALEGYRAPETSRPEAFDAGLQATLANFQRHHDLPDDGVLRPGTRAALNVPAATRADEIEANLERWRWLPHQLPAQRLEVDVAGQSVRLLQADCETLSMRVVVGDPQHRTPMFISEVQAVTFNPPWNVPASIAAAEILPKAAKDPGYLAANDFIFVEGRLQQKAGPKSALGQIKFELPSPFGVYLHDTPGKAAFQRSKRDLSHGCMRLEKPAELAALLLAPQGWTPQTVTGAIAAGRTQTVRLKTPTPLYVLYWTAVVDATGFVSFRPDIYGWDTKLAEALAASGR
jgi:murein L,D-transpeptidase YcbB/YkuD